MYDAGAESVTLQLAELVGNSATSRAGAAGGGGGRLVLAGAGVALGGEGGAGGGYVALCRDERYRPRLGAGEYA